MDLFMVFNELSVQPRSASKQETVYTARGWMEGFVRTMQAASQCNIRILRTYRRFVEIELMPDYSLRQWLGDQEVDREMRRYVQSRATKAPYLEDVPDVEDRSRLFDFKLGNQRVYGLGAAYMLESLAVSLNCDMQWNIGQLEVGIEELDETSEDIKEYSQPIKHASTAEHVAEHSSWIQTRLETSVSDGNYLLKQAEFWFTKLEFTPTAREQIKVLTSGTPQLRQLVCKLFAFEAYCREWKAGGFDRSTIPHLTLESQSVRNDPDLRTQRVFKRDNGEERFCEWHARLTPGPWRLHFDPDPEQRKVIIGYVGPHLPTSKHRR